MNRLIAERLVRSRMSKLHESEGVPASYYSKVEKMLNYQLGDHETDIKVTDIRIKYEAPGTITLDVEYEVNIRLPIVDPEDHSTYYENDVEYRRRTMTLDTEDLDESSGESSAKSYSDDERKEIFDRWCQYQKSNNKPAPEYGYRGYTDTTYDIWKSALEEDLSLDDDPEETEQQYTSAATSINSSKLPALFRMVDFEEGSINLDYGGGRFDNVAEYLMSEYGATNLVYDKYNRSAEHNREVLAQVRQNGGADTVTCSNVLNVIAEESERLAVLRNCKRYLKSGGTCYITVYEGNGTGEGAPTKAGYQLNRKTKDYEEEISQVFSNVSRKGKLFICR